MSGLKTKTIEKIIKDKTEHWFKSIDDESLRNRVRDDFIVTGGAITSMLLGETPNDFDVYLQTSEVAVDLANYYLNKYISDKDEKLFKVAAIASEDRVRIKIKSSGALGEEINASEYQYFEGTDGDEAIEFFNKNKGKETPYGVALVTDNAISLYNDIQIIIRFVGNPEEIHKNFDFIHTTNYYTNSGGLVLNLEALTATMSKTLTYSGSLYPICSLFRIRKFIERGWSITAGEILKISWDISKLDLEDLNVLQEQLVGVDSAYFNEIIWILKKDDRKDIERSYLINIIDKVFRE